MDSYEKEIARRNVQKLEEVIEKGKGRYILVHGVALSIFLFLLYYLSTQNDSFLGVTTALEFFLFLAIFIFAGLIGGLVGWAITKRNYKKLQIHIQSSI